MPTERRKFTVRLTPEAHDVLIAFHEEYGPSVNALIEALARLLGEASEEQRQAVLAVTRAARKRPRR